MNGLRAFTAGVVAGVILSVLLALGRAVGLRLDLPWILGTLASPRPTTYNWMVGYAMYLALSGVIGLIYAAAFTVVARAGWRVGALFGIGHAIVAGLLLGLASAVNPAIRHHHLASPGLFLSNWGVFGVIVLFAFCIFYGALVGYIYGPERFRLVD